MFFGVLAQKDKSGFGSNLSENSNADPDPTKVAGSGSAAPWLLRAFYSKNIHHHHLAKPICIIPCFCVCYYIILYTYSLSTQSNLHII